jgi:hypothetical protein
MAANLEDQEDEAFLRTLIRCEEDRRRLHPDVVWSGGYRWFQSPNVICLEKARAARSGHDADE